MIDGGKVFTANTNNTAKVRNDIKTKVIASAVRVFPLSWNIWPSMKFDVLYMDV